MSELDLNAKAAIAGGLWTPGATCGEGKNMQCNHPFWYSREDTNPAPDMNDPRNWVKALENLAAHEPALFWDCCWYCHLSHGDLQPRTKATGIGLTKPSKAVIVALAALYDAEHAEEAGRCNHAENATLIAAARNELPRLLDENDAFKRELATMRDELARKTEQMAAALNHLIEIRDSPTITLIVGYDYEHLDAAIAAEHLDAAIAALESGKDKP